MSGGSWDYFYQRLEEVAERLRASNDPLRKAFGTHLNLCATALHDIEWVDSNDFADGAEAKNIKAALGQQGRELILTEIKTAAETALNRLQADLKTHFYNEG